MGTPSEHRCLRCGYPLPRLGVTCPECGAAYNEGALQRVDELREIGEVGWIMVAFAWIVVGGLVIMGADDGRLALGGTFFWVMLAPAAIFPWWKFRAKHSTNKESVAYRAAVALMPWGLAAVIVVVFMLLRRLS